MITALELAAYNELLDKLAKLQDNHLREKVSVLAKEKRELEVRLVHESQENIELNKQIQEAVRIRNQWYAKYDALLKEKNLLQHVMSAESQPMVAEHKSTAVQFDEYTECIKKMEARIKTAKGQLQLAIKTLE